jgi:succinate dehydrogenase / fumarate reductase flavoprotein subunit
MRNVSDGSMELFEAKNVILATGGNGQTWQPTTNALICTGDGIAMAYRVGAPLMDMEMIQYHPTTLAKKGFLITEGARGEGAHLLNANGERFMERYAPNKMELASRDVVSRAEQTEINEGRGFPDGTVALDITVVPRKRIHEALREIVLVGRDFAGVDITREPIHIKPGNHYTMGGVKTDIHGATSIPGLYAAGEVACVSVHGGNRLGANSLLDTLIFGRRAGEHASTRAKGTEFGRVSGAPLADTEREISALIARDHGKGRRISELRRELGEVMDRHVAVFRDADGINKALETVKRLQEELPNAYIDDRGTVFNQDVLGAMELGFMLDGAECTCVAALHRTESRGAQYRTEFPERNDEEWLKHIDLTRNTDGPEVSYSPVTITQWQPTERTY